MYQSSWAVLLLDFPSSFFSVWPCVCPEVIRCPKGHLISIQTLKPSAVQLPIQFAGNAESGFSAFTETDLNRASFMSLLLSEVVIDTVVLSVNTSSNAIIKGSININMWFLQGKFSYISYIYSWQFMIYSIFLDLLLSLALQSFIASSSSLFSRPIHNPVLVHAHWFSQCESSENPPCTTCPAPNTRERRLVTIWSRMWGI